MVPRDKWNDTNDGFPGVGAQGAIWYTRNYEKAE